jgi:MoxR-like ATPase
MGNAARDPATILGQWVERDLTAAARAGELRPAFEMGDVFDEIGELISAGRHPIVVGEPGVGKTAAIHELLRRSVDGDGPLANRQVLQISLRQRAAGLARPDLLRPEMQKLVEALLAADGRVVPFFRDVHLAYNYDCEPLLVSLAQRLGGPILAEGERATLAAMIEGTPEIGERFVTVEIEEPDLARAGRILAAWAADQARAGQRFEPEALAEALSLTHRFLSRDRLPRKALDLLAQVASLGGGARVGPAAVIDRFCRRDRVPRILVDPDAILDLDEVASAFRAQVLGQAEAVQAAMRMISLIKAGLSDARRPFGAFLFVGPTGVGKTHLAQCLASYLFGSGERMVRLNMADFESEQDAATLFGDPVHPLLPYRVGVLTRRLMGRPFAVVLFDELEKAHPKIHDRLLQLIDEGAFINGAGELVSCRSCILIATSNCGAELYRGHALGFTGAGDLESIDREVDRRLNATFRFEFLNRFDQVVHFHPLSRADIRTIARRELLALESRSGLARRGVRLEMDESVIDWLAVHGYDPFYGARVLRRALERHVAVAVADALVRARLQPGALLEVSVRGHEVVARVLPTAAPRPPREALTLPHGPGERVVSLDPAGLLAEAQRVETAAQSLLALLERRKAERSRILAALNDSRAWDAAARDRLDTYRDLDVTIAGEERLASPLRRLAALRAEAPEGTTPATAALARAVEEAASALRQWEERLCDDGPRRLWVLLSDLDHTEAGEEWLLDLLKIERQWLKRLGLAVEVAAYEAVDKRLARVALHVEGPGALLYLSMEEGLHRLWRPRGRPLRVQVARAPAGAASDTLQVQTVRRRRGLLDLEITCRGRLEHPDTGNVMEWLGADPATLGSFLGDLAHSQRTLQDAPAVARIYGEDGCGAFDPRTGSRVPRMKDVRTARLDALLEAWRRRG